MEEWIIFRFPAALMLYGIALFFCLFERKNRATKGAFHWISAALAILATAYSLLCGASLRECAAALTVFLLLNMEVMA